MLCGEMWLFVSVVWGNSGCLLVLCGEMWLFVSVVWGNVAVC